MRTLSSLPRPFAVQSLLAACLLGCLGCGGEKVVPVKGTVTHNGKPVDGIIISFVPQAVTKAGVSLGQTDEDGRYALTVATTKESGAVVGTHKVWVSLPRTPEKPKSHDPEEILKEQAARTKSVHQQPSDLVDIMKKYGKLDTTPLTVEVTGGQTIDLKLD
jgi:hypothetical protein